MEMIKIRVRKHRKQPMEKHRRRFMKRYAKIFVSCLLTFTMVFTSVQWSAIVNETTVVGAAETVPKEKKEVVEEESTKDSTTVQMKDGKKQTVFYLSLIHIYNVCIYCWRRQSAGRESFRWDKIFRW